MTPNFLVKWFLILACVFDMRNHAKMHIIAYEDNKWSITVAT